MLAKGGLNYQSHHTVLVFDILFCISLQTDERHQWWTAKYTRLKAAIFCAVERELNGVKGKLAAGRVLNTMASCGGDLPVVNDEFCGVTSPACLIRGSTMVPGGSNGQVLPQKNAQHLFCYWFHSNIEMVMRNISIKMWAFATCFLLYAFSAIFIYYLSFIPIFPHPG